jgi:putative methanogen marker protein 4
MLSLSLIEKKAKKNLGKIGIGDGGGDLVARSAGAAEENGFAQVEIYNNPHGLVSALKKGEIEAGVRGTLSAKTVMDELKSQFGVERILRIAFLAVGDGRLVLLAPVGIDEGQSSEERMELISLGCELLAKLKAEPKVGVLSGGRLEDIGRHLKVNEMLMEGEKLTRTALDDGVQAKHFGILLEKAVESSNFVIAPDGITGNLIFRALHYFGGAKGIGAPVVNLDRLFVDTSRDKEDYTWSIALASAFIDGEDSQG